MDDKTLRKSLLDLLNGGNAYAPIEKILRGIKAKNRHARPADGIHSVWEELEHMRIAQEDILHYTLDPNWRSPSWPEGYWPDPDLKPTSRTWDSAVQRFTADLGGFQRLVRNQKTDLTAQIPHGEGRTYLRQVLLAADHNAYHTGQIVLVRKLLKDWPA